MSPVWQRWGFRVVTASVIVSALAYIPYRVTRSDGYTRYVSLQRELAETERDNETVRAENRALRREIQSLRDELYAVAKVARDELGMLAPGEVAIQFHRRDATRPSRGAFGAADRGPRATEPKP